MGLPVRRLPSALMPSCLCPDPACRTDSLTLGKTHDEPWAGPREVPEGMTEKWSTHWFPSLAPVCRLKFSDGGGLQLDHSVYCVSPEACETWWSEPSQALRQEAGSVLWQADPVPFKV